VYWIGALPLNSLNLYHSKAPSTNEVRVYYFSLWEKQFLP
jgi:hypothetical protein